jgi:predicted DNA-binding protein with PD1-like motif
VPTYAVVLDEGDEAISTLCGVARDLALTAASFTGIGGFERAELGFFDLSARDYQHIPLNEQAEVVSLIGDISCSPDEDAVVHAHVVLATRDGFAHGGHLLQGIVRPTLEVVVRSSPAHLRRRHDARTGLALLDLDEHH